MFPWASLCCPQTVTSTPVCGAFLGLWQGWLLQGTFAQDYPHSLEKWEPSQDPKEGWVFSSCEEEHGLQFVTRLTTAALPLSPSAASAGFHLHPHPRPQRPHTCQAAAGDFNKVWADSCFLALKGKEEGHHLCKKRESEALICRGSYCSLSLEHSPAGALLLSKAPK